MKDSYCDSEHWASIDLIEAVTCHIITRVEVRRKFRGNGYAKLLMDRVLHDADKENVTLMLAVYPDPDTDYTRLYQWYQTLGFEYYDEDIMIRYPSQGPLTQR